eukprot:7089847-Lingulodinium_polyedra.AAC.1
MSFFASAPERKPWTVEPNEPGRRGAVEAAEAAAGPGAAAGAAAWASEAATGARALAQESLNA